MADLTGLPVACTSLLDEATAVAEAVLLMARAHRGPDAPVLLDSGLHPQLIEVASARAEALGIDVEVVCTSTITDDGAPLTGAVLAHTRGRLRRVKSNGQQGLVVGCGPAGPACLVRVS